MEPESTSLHPDEDLFHFLTRLSRLGFASAEGESPDVESHEEFLRNTWEAARAGLLSRTDRIRVEPTTLPGSWTFRFEIDLAYKRQERPGQPVEVAEGPIRGSIYYRPDPLLAIPGDPVVQVRLEDRAYLHPNYSREFGVFCPGKLPPGLVDLEVILELIYACLSYQIVNAEDPADRAAAELFDSDPCVLEGLGETPPLY